MFNSNAGTLPVSIPIGVGNGGGFGNGNGFDDIIALAIIAMIFGWNGNGGIFGGSGRNGVNDAYILNTDMAAIESKIDGVNNGLCSLGYDQLSQMNNINTNILQSANGIQNAINNCCCQTQQNIKDTQYALATESAGVQRAIKDCCCENEMIAMQNKYDAAQQNCATLTAIDKLGDRIIGYMDAEKTAQLRDELQAYKWQASQDKQNLFIQNLVKPQINPCYVTQNPYCSCGNAYPYGYGYGSTIA